MNKTNQTDKATARPWKLGGEYGYEVHGQRTISLAVIRWSKEYATATQPVSIAAG